MVSKGIDEKLHDDLLQRFDGLQGQECAALVDGYVEDVPWGDSNDPVQLTRYRMAPYQLRRGLRAAAAAAAAAARTAAVAAA
eukprot:COSAG04_NODE_256_length_18763_cov_60.353140_13_plen_82_part_00